MYSRNLHPVILAGLTLLFLYSCRSSAPLLDLKDLEPADLPAEEILDNIPDYRRTLTSVSGIGRAIVSEPDNSERVSVQFQSSRRESLIKVRNSLGIEGGQIYVDSDSLLIYNRIDHYAEKVPLHESRLTKIGAIASVNILELLNYTEDPQNVASTYQSEDYFVLLMKNGSYIQVDKTSGVITEVIHMSNPDAPYSRIEYAGYSDVNGFRLPRRITIYSRDGQARAALLVQRIETNVSLPPLQINLPDDIPVIR